MAMRVPVEWIAEYVEIDVATDRLSDVLTNIGLAVEAVEEHPAAGTVLEIEVTSNRADCYGMIGIARELAAATGKPLRMPDLELDESGTPAADLCSVEVLDPDLCPRYTARVIEGVTIGGSPDWMARRLEGAGLRPINNIVDVTNYVMLEFCQPLHAFDAALLAESRIMVRRAGDREKMSLLDESEVELSPENLVIADPNGAVALAGVMGGLESEVRPDTKTVLLESAQFDRVNIRRSSRSLAVSSDSSFRFERGVDPVGVELASRRAARLMAELSGGCVAKGLVDVRAGEWKAHEVTMRFARLDKLMGHRYDAGGCTRILEGLGLERVSRDAATITVTVPPWRPDIEREVDLIEEVARIRGYDEVEPASTLRVDLPKTNDLDVLRRSARRVMRALGYDEALTDSFTDPRGAPHFRFWSPGDALRVSNPISQMQDALRESLLPNLLAAKRNNQDAGREQVTLFEVASIYLAGEDGSPFELPALALVDDRGFFAAKGAVESLCAELGLAEPPTFRKAGLEGLQALRSSEIVLGGDRVGVLGEISAAVGKAYDLETAPSVAEIDLGALLDAPKAELRFEPLPRYPGVRRDLALIVDRAIAWGEVRRTTEAELGENAVRLDLVSVYEGDPVPTGRKSVAVTVLYRSPDRTLTTEEVNSVHEAFAERLCKKLGATIRTT